MLQLPWVYYPSKNIMTIQKKKKKSKLKEGDNYIASKWKLFAFSPFDCIAFFGSCVLLFYKLTLLDKVLFSEVCQMGTKGRFLPVFRTTFAIVSEIPDWGWLEG